MDIVFENGKELYLKEKSKDPITFIENTQGKRLNCYQKQMILGVLGHDEKPYNIYGDDFKIEITPCNVFQGNCALGFYDYDENQKLECDIVVDFNKEELGQFIHILTDIHKNMKVK
jgi:hypothetical protein